MGCNTISVMGLFGLLLRPSARGIKSDISTSRHQPSAADNHIFFGHPSWPPPTPTPTSPRRRSPPPPRRRRTSSTMPSARPSMGPCRAPAPSSCSVNPSTLTMMPAKDGFQLCHRRRAQRRRRSAARLLPRPPPRCHQHSNAPTFANPRRRGPEKTVG